LSWPMADKFNAGNLTKPVLRKGEFYSGGFFAMKKRVEAALFPFPGAYAEFASRTENLSVADAALVMFDYIEVE